MDSTSIPQRISSLPKIGRVIVQKIPRKGAVKEHTTAQSMTVFHLRPRCHQSIALTLGRQIEELAEIMFEIHNAVAGKVRTEDIKYLVTCATAVDITRVELISAVTKAQPRGWSMRYPVLLKTAFELAKLKMTPGPETSEIPMPDHVWEVALVGRPYVDIMRILDVYRLLYQIELGEARNHLKELTQSRDAVARVRAENASSPF
ncbi:hypothetical protein M501DRAFT_987963 [Patellaria atrata CBS 101060]|uniref:Uncharacterized protein n=1 Tax=Patellaria atrata CBS 101060 TaxID=1346257 RepID=A0A9P4VJT7_9PEZI|nr:hypothetical protein M501DRAFT_987963 [Patellaria atrata CBS 101060]